MTRTPRITMSVLAAGLLAAVALLSFFNDALAVGTDRVSVGHGGAQANGSSSFPSVSADGRFVAFQTGAPFDPSDTGSSTDVYLRDTMLGVTTLVSRATGATGTKGNATSSDPSISSDGRYVVFTSAATNLDPAATNSALSVFIRDLTGNTTKLVSRAGGVSGAEGNGHDFEGSVSGDGRYVAFTSGSTNFDPLDNSGTSDVYVRDLFANTTVLASRVGGTKANGFSNSAAISVDGRYVAFSSSATNLDPNDICSCSDVYVHDTLLLTATLVSRPTGTGTGGNGVSSAPSMNLNGRYIAFQSEALNMDPADTDSLSDIFVRDTLTNTTKLVSRATGPVGPKGNEGSYHPAISTSGRFVSFDSDAANLDSNDAGEFTDVFLRDTQANSTLAISLSNSAVHGDNQSLRPSTATDGTTVFESPALNLVPADTNGSSDVFRVDDLDRDGMSNNYESLNLCLKPSQADGSEDSDFDGLANGGEAAIGLDPCDTDTDNDSRWDSVDECPYQPEDGDGFEDGDGCLDTDNDGDGICDEGQSSSSCGGSDSGQMCFDPARKLECGTIDCRSLAEDLDAFKDADGCPEPDNDNDGFPDASDSCPGTDTRAGDDGMLGANEDENHNGVQDGNESALTTDDVMPALVWEDSDGVLDTDGCHDSPGNDFDGDGFTDDAEVFTHLTDAGHPDTDADAVMDGADNCPLWANAAQNPPAWAVPANDSDCDGFNVSRERHVGTDPTRHCNVTTALNDEADFWPGDFNDNKITNLPDLVSFGPTFNKLPGQPGYNQRYDLNATNQVLLSDVILMGPYFNMSCS